jgi:hypothetical protein
VPHTRSVYADRNTGGLYVDIVPDREALARHGLTLGDLQDVIEAAIGGEPIAVTVEGRERYTINVRYPSSLRQDVERLRQVLVPIHRGGANGAGGTMGALGRDALPTGALLASNGSSDSDPMSSEGGMPPRGTSMGSNPGAARPRRRWAWTAGGPPAARTCRSARSPTSAWSAARP